MSGRSGRPGARSASGGAPPLAQAVGGPASGRRGSRRGPGGPRRATRSWVALARRPSLDHAAQHDGAETAAATARRCSATSSSRRSVPSARPRRRSGTGGRRRRRRRRPPRAARTSQPSPLAAWRTRPGALDHGVDGGVDPPGVGPVQCRERRRRGPPGPAGPRAGARSRCTRSSRRCRARLTADGDWLTWWVTHPTYQSSSWRRPFLTTAAAARLGLDRHHRVDEGGGVDHSQRLAQVAAPPGHRRVRPGRARRARARAGAAGRPRPGAAAPPRRSRPSPGRGRPWGRRRAPIPSAGSLPRCVLPAQTVSDADGGGADVAASVARSERRRGARPLRKSVPVARPGFITSNGTPARASRRARRPGSGCPTTTSYDAVEQAAAVDDPEVHDARPGPGARSKCWPMMSVSVRISGRPSAVADLERRRRRPRSGPSASKPTWTVRALPAQQVRALGDARVLDTEPGRKRTGRSPHPGRAAAAAFASLGAAGAGRRRCPPGRRSTCRGPRPRAAAPGRCAPPRRAHPRRPSRRRLRTTARSQIERTWSGECETKRMVRPSSWNRLMRSMHLRWKRSSPTASTSSIDQDVGVHVDGHGEAQPDVHARGVELDLVVDELLELGEGDDVVEDPVDLAACDMPSIEPFR